MQFRYADISYTDSVGTITDLACVDNGWLHLRDGETVTTIPASRVEKLVWHRDGPVHADRPI